MTSENTPAAVKFSERAYKLLKDRGWISNGKLINQQGFDSLTQQIGHPEAVLGILGNMYWLLDSPEAAIELYETAAKIDKTQELFFMISSARIYYDMGHYDQALKIATVGIREIKSLEEQLPLIAAHYYFIAAASATAVNDYKLALSYTSNLLKRNINNYAFAHDIVTLGILLHNLTGQHTEAKDIFSRYETNGKIFTDERYLVQKAWTLCCLKDFPQALNTFRMIDTVDVKTIDESSYAQYLSLGNFFASKKLFGSEVHDFEKDAKQFSSAEGDFPVRYYLNSAHLGYKTDDKEYTWKYLRQSSKEEKKNESEFSKAGYLELQGLQYIKEGRKNKAKETLETALIIYKKQEDKFIYQVLSLQQLLTTL